MENGIKEKIDRRIGQWNQFVNAVYGDEKEAYHELVTIIRERVPAIDATEEKEVGIAMLLAAVTYLKGEVNFLRRVWDEENRLKSRYYENQYYNLRRLALQLKVLRLFYLKKP